MQFLIHPLEVQLAVAVLGALAGLFALATRGAGRGLDVGLGVLAGIGALGFFVLGASPRQFVKTWDVQHSHFGAKYARELGYFLTVYGDPNYDRVYLDRLNRATAADLGALGIGGESVLIVIPESDAHVERSARNLPLVSVVQAKGLNVYDVLRHKSVVLTKEAARAVQERLGAASEGAAS